jgi:alcohol dehydrogenase (cytochrome c)
MELGRVGKGTRLRVVATVLAAGVGLAACGGSSKTAFTACGTSANRATNPPGSASWPYPNGDLANTRSAVGSTISSANVSRLAQTWTFTPNGRPPPYKENYGLLAANPIVQNGVVYMQDLDSNVYAIALTTGKLEWECRLNQPERSGPGPNGVAVAGGTVYGDSPTTVFALNAATGKEVWANSSVLGSGQGTFGIQPQVAGGRVYLASQYGTGPGGGILVALSATTGKVLWKFNTLLGTDAGVEAIGAGSGGAWQTPLVSSDGSVTYGIGNPYQSPASAIAHPSRQLYSDSDVNLDAATGKLRWYFQAVTNDFKDYDLQTSPILASVDGSPTIISAGKMGYVYAINAESGKLIWKTPVGKHNGHDDDSLLLLEHKLKLTAPYTFIPGGLGGVVTNPALAGNTIYVATCDLQFTLPSLTDVDGSPDGSLGTATGEIEAINLSSGKVEWDTKVPRLPLGSATVSNDLVFTTLYSGVLIALNRKTGAIVYSRRLPTTANSPIAIAGNTVLVPAGGSTLEISGGHPKLVAYSVR